MENGPFQAMGHRGQQGRWELLSWALLPAAEKRAPLSRHWSWVYRWLSYVFARELWDEMNEADVEQAQKRAERTAYEIAANAVHLAILNGQWAGAARDGRSAQERDQTHKALLRIEEMLRQQAQRSTTSKRNGNGRT